MGIISSDSVILITGASSGIGRAIVLEFVRSGGRKFVLCDLNTEHLSETVSLAREILSKSQSGPEEAVAGELEMLTAGTDVTKEEEVEKLVSDAVERFGRIDHSVHCAGILSNTPGPTASVPTSSAYDAVMAVNSRGVWMCDKFVLAQMQNQEPRGARKEFGEGRGTVVNIASILGLIGMRNSSGYVASKHAVVGITKADAADYGKFGIRVNAVCPGFCATNLLRGEVLNRINQIVAARSPIPRTGLPEEIANAVVFLSSEKASFITGAAIPVDGGYTAV